MAHINLFDRSVTSRGETGIVTDNNLRELVANRAMFPCCFGSGLKLGEDGFTLA